MPKVSRHGTASLPSRITAMKPTSALSLSIALSLLLLGCTSRPSARQNAGQPIASDYVIEEVAGGLEVPWSIVFTSPTRMLVTERPGRIRVIENGKLLTEPLHVFSEVVSDAEEGLMGMTLNPDYESNHYLYVALAYEANGTQDKVVRFTDESNQLSDPQVLMDNIPAAQFHAGCRLGFGPAGKLYITTGDATERTLAQDVNLLNGKILRINRDGSIPSDNPFPNNPMWSYGHRNPQGIDWHPANGELYSSEHGPSGGDGPGGGDEVNRIVKGGNYGWPLVSHERTRDGTIAPLIVFTPADAPASLLVYSGKALPDFKHNLFFGCLRGQGIMRLVLDPNNKDKITHHEKIATTYGRIRDVIEGPDGFIYFSTSNRDGRGSPQADDDRILRIRPK